MENDKTFKEEIDKMCQDYEVHSIVRGNIHKTFDKFIKRLKDFARSDRWTAYEMLAQIDKLAGDKLK